MIDPQCVHRSLVCASLAMLAIAAASCGDGSPTQPTQGSFQSRAQGPSTTPAQSAFVMSGQVHDRLTNGTIANARLEVTQGANIGRTTFTDSGGSYRLEQLTPGALHLRITATDYDPSESDVSISSDATMNFQLTPVMPYVYSGIVTDGTGHPVAAATVRGGPNSGVTDANGRYEFRSPYSSVPGNVFPPAGYEPKPYSRLDSFDLTPGMNISIRRITAVNISPPATVKAGAGRVSFGVQISFDTGQVESPHLDYLHTTSSNAAILRADSGNGVFPNPYLEGIAPGTASVVSTYFGASSSAAPVQVIP